MNPNLFSYLWLQMSVSFHAVGSLWKAIHICLSVLWHVKLRKDILPVKCGATWISWDRMYWFVLMNVSSTP